MKNNIKNIIVGCLIVFMGFSTVYAQPEAFNYQGIAVDNNGQVLSNETIGLQFTILNENNILMVESHQVNTTSIGHFAANVGFGTQLTGDFMSIDWANGSYFLRIEMDAEGGSDYTYSNEVELLSVPYALVVENSGPNVPIGPAGPAGITGATGATGATGLTGLPGFNGGEVPGSRGPKGATGSKGDPGIQGENGNAGGLTGPVGPPGDKGPTGSSIGDPGPMGSPGPDGPPGPQGPRGFDGPMGPTGPSSTNIGPIGAPGPQGPAGGPTGSPGPIGPQGMPGITGAPGPSGPQGKSFFELAEITDIVPTPSPTLNLYVDDGSNREDGKPGLRFYNGTAWIDL